MRCFIDMDGVVADFDGSAARLHGRENAYQQSERGDHVWDVFSRWSITPEEFYSPMDYNFWRNLEETQEAGGIVELCLRLFGRLNVAFLTSPCRDPYCISAKQDWVSEHFPPLSGRVLAGSIKEMCAHPGAILIDDNSQNCVDFRDYGGNAFLVPRPWNADWSREGTLLVDLERYLHAINRLVTFSQ